MSVLSDDEVDEDEDLVVISYSTDDILKQLEYIRDVTDLNRSARAAIAKRTTELVQRGWEEGLSIRQMARALGVTAQAVRFRIPGSDRPLARVNIKKKEKEQ